MNHRINPYNDYMESNNQQTSIYHSLARSRTDDFDSLNNSRHNHLHHYHHYTPPPPPTAPPPPPPSQPPHVNRFDHHHMQPSNPDEEEAEVEEQETEEVDQSARIIKKIVQDLVDLQNQIMGGKCSPIHPNSLGVTNKHLAGSSEFNGASLLHGVGVGGVDMESVILKSSDPIEIEGDEIMVNGQRGIWANRMEAAGWKGDVPIEQYPINQDPNPELIVKKSKAKLEFVQEMAIR